ncbi:hypothetical protein ACIQMZ_37300 [Streptomyces longwoodensis]|uniref:hypothetical protein n=1 Tax=Streptomyces longwoodensis TaxID=68231 RepID=UPI0037FCC96C
MPVEAAYAAARDRLHRMTDALLLTEAQNVDLHRRLDAALAEIERLKRLIPEKEVSSDAEGDPVGYAAAVGQAD